MRIIERTWEKQDTNTLRNAVRHIQDFTETNRMNQALIDHFTRCKQHWSRNTSCFSL